MFSRYRRRFSPFVLARAVPLALTCLFLLNIKGSRKTVTVSVRDGAHELPVETVLTGDGESVIPTIEATEDASFWTDVSHGVCGFCAPFQRTGSQVRSEPSHLGSDIKNPEEPRHIAIGRILGERGALRGAELGVQRGKFSKDLLGVWSAYNISPEYLLVDVWKPLGNYFDGANVNESAQERIYEAAKEATSIYNTQICRNLTVTCAERAPNDSFDFIYVDARHDFKGVMMDLEHWFPKLKQGGVIAGHDYVPATKQFEDKSVSKYYVNFDGTLDITLKGGMGAVDLFFASKGFQIDVVDTKNPWPTWIVDTSRKYSQNQVPKILHFCWIDTNWDSEQSQVPMRIVRIVNEWQKINRGWASIIWTNSLIKRKFPTLFAELRKITVPAWAANLVRYHVLAKYGGLYLDTDIEPINPLKDYMTQSSFTVCEESREGKCLSACNAVIGVTLADATGVMQLVANAALKKSLKLLKTTSRFSYGPGLTGPTFWSFAAFSKDSGFKVLLPETFYPCSWRDRSKCIKANFIDSKHVVAMHTWEHSWSGRG